MDMYENDFYKNTQFQIQQINNSLDTCVNGVQNAVSSVPARVSEKLSHCKWDDAVGEKLKGSVNSTVSKEAEKWRYEHVKRIEEAVTKTKNALQTVEEALAAWSSSLSLVEG